MKPFDATAGRSASQDEPGDASRRLPALSMTERTVAAAHRVLAGERRGPGAVLAFAGPAIVASIAYMDPGNFATNIQAGAKYGYGLLWVVLLANVIAMLFQALSAKLGIVTGKNLAEHCRDALPAAGRLRDVDRL